jgi:hypothetical protein
LPVIFTIVKAIIRDVEACQLKELATTTQLFHANDGAIADNKPKKVQKLVDNCTKRFARVKFANEQQENQGNGNGWGKATNHDVTARRSTKKEVQVNAGPSGESRSKNAAPTMWSHET